MMECTPARPLLGALLAQRQLRLQFKVIDSCIECKVTGPY